MERKIIFRGKRVVDGKWVYGDLHLQCLKPHIHTQPIDGTIIGLKFNINTDTIGQFTGLYDRNQKPIYEGDIVQWEECVADYTFITQKSEVFYSENSASFEPLNEFNYCDFEVIGNIYDNNELLGE